MYMHIVTVQPLMQNGSTVGYSLYFNIDKPYDILNYTKLPPIQVPTFALKLNHAWKRNLEAIIVLTFYNYATTLLCLHSLYTTL